MSDIFARGGPVMWPLAALSLVGVTVIVERVIFWVRLRLGRDRELVIRFLDLVDAGDYAGATDAARGSRDYVVRILHSGLVHRNYSLESALQMAADDEARQMGRSLAILDTIITMAPLLGILGTVLGIIQSFDLLGALEVVDPEGVTSGISKALITTASGLTIALVVLVPYNYFQAKIARAVSEIEQYATSLQIVFHKHEREGLPGAGATRGGEVEGGAT